ncbi:MAG: hypothetical protein ACE5FR_05840 [Rhodospirillales bacterium]
MTGRSAVGLIAGRGAVVFGECGGYMVPGRALVDRNGYRRAALAAGGPLGAAGTGFRGHEFHFARIIEEGPGAPLFECADASGLGLGPAGLTGGRVMGSFVHLIDGEGDG